MTNQQSILKAIAKSDDLSSLVAIVKAAEARIEEVKSDIKSTVKVKKTDDGYELINDKTSEVYRAKKRANGHYDVYRIESGKKNLVYREYKFGIGSLRLGIAKGWID